MITTISFHVFSDARIHTLLFLKEFFDESTTLVSNSIKLKGRSFIFDLRKICYYIGFSDFGKSFIENYEVRFGLFEEPIKTMVINLFNAILNNDSDNILSSYDSLDDFYHTLHMRKVCREKYSKEQLPDSVVNEITHKNYNDILEKYVWSKM